MFLLTAGTHLTVWAAASGSVELRVPEAGEGVQITLYRVAEAENGTYAYVDAFAECGVRISDMNNNEQMQEAAVALAAFAQEHKAEGVQGVIDAKGVLRFEELSPALYLTAQTSGEELLKVQPALIPLPYYVGGTQGESYGAVISAKNTFPGGAVIAQKVDETGAALPGAGFVLQKKTYLAEGETAPEGAQSGSDGSGNYFWKQFETVLTSNGKGQFAVHDLSTGEYRFVETQAPEGYVLSGKAYPFTVRRAGTITEVSGGYDAAGGTVESVRIENFPITMYIRKTDPQGSPVEGARLLLKDASGAVIRDENGLPKYLFTTTREPYELKKLPAGKYFVSELEAPSGFSVARDVEIELSNMDGAVNEVRMVDEPEQNTGASLTVTKQLTDAQGSLVKPGRLTFYVALFEDAARKIRISAVKPLVFENGAAASVTFEHLKMNVPYYVGETNEYGELQENGLAANLVYAAEYPEGQQAAPTEEKPQAQLTFRNVFKDAPHGYYYEGALTLTKKVIINCEETDTDRVFYAALFTDAARTQRYGDVITLDMDGSSTLSVEVPVYIGDENQQGVRYYISETDKDGTPLGTDDGLGFTVSIDKGSVVMSPQHMEDEVVITNTFREGEGDDGGGSPSGGGGSGGGSGAKGGIQTGDDTPVAGVLMLAAVSLAAAVWLAARRTGHRKQG